VAFAERDFFGTGGEQVPDAAHPVVGRDPGLGTEAELAGQIASGRAERKHRASGQEVVERFLLDGVDAEAGRPSVRRQHHRIVHARAHEARAALPLVQLAIARAEIALDASILETVPPAPGVMRSFDRIANALVHRYFSTV
jgi:hypothetical protein